MKKVFALLISAALPVAAVAHAAEPLKLNADNKLYCNAQTDWCVGIKTDGTFEENGPFATSRTLRADRRFWDAPDVPDFTHFTVWPELIRLDEERALVGVIGPAEPDYKLETPISGGSFTRKDLYLYEVSLGEQPGSNLVFVTPYSTNASIRGCSNQTEEQKRDGHCSDTYHFQALLKAIPGKKADAGKNYPDLQVTTQATRVPVGVSREADATAKPTISASQLTPVTDRQCSYTATYQWQAAASVYEPTAKLPDCAKFLRVNLK
ncbi:hypothetical protein RAS12_27310 [Achromobacter seleniivolatilans]|uniref:Uncharacterized protein n=1 Tax=Achromobacter seleniivolatilans TaxID=3047478 RepID=A0ABY9LZS8_9BURK|nr:hypothetical protein [Achromobacter sp. R39]WMD20273.1 hypothetical protein RAS12_27310 [Achromobacter sp. R39]